MENNENKPIRKPDGTFQKGVSGNAKGRPKKKQMTKEDMIDEFWAALESMLPTLQRDLKKMTPKDRWSTINMYRKLFLQDEKTELKKNEDVQKDFNINVIFGKKPDKKEDKTDEPMND